MYLVNAQVAADKVRELVLGGVLAGNANGGFQGGPGGHIGLPVLHFSFQFAGKDRRFGFNIDSLILYSVETLNPRGVNFLYRQPHCPIIPGTDVTGRSGLRYRSQNADNLVVVRSGLLHGRRQTDNKEYGGEYRDPCAKSFYKNTSDFS